MSETHLAGRLFDTVVCTHSTAAGDGGSTSYTLELASSPGDLPIIDDFDGQTTSRSHLLRWNGTPIGSIRACLGIVGEVETPAARVFGDALSAFLTPGTRYVEADRFVVSPAHQHAHPIARSLLFRAIAINMVLDAATFVVTAVNERHMTYYRRMMGFEAISGPRPYYGLTLPTVLMAADGVKHWAEGVRKNPLLAPPPEELERYQRLAARTFIES